MARFVVDGEMRLRRASSWPLATFVINVFGSFLLGCLTGAELHPTFVAFAATGLCGGFTTFSTASVETLTMLRRRRGLPALAYASGSAGVCVLAVAAGAALTG